MEQKNGSISGRGDDYDATEPIYQYPCPFLGASQDATSVMSYPTVGNRCYALGDALEVAREKQRTHCLSENYSSCHIHQQVLAKQSEMGNTANKVGILDRVLQARSIALAVMLLLILLAALVWWPFPGLGVQDRTVFGATFVQNSQETQIPEKEPVVENAVQPARAEEGDSESIAVQTQADAGGERNVAKPTAVPPLDISELPDLYQLFQIRQEEDEDNELSGGGFSPIAYSGEGVEIPSISGGVDDEPTLRIYLVLPEEEKGQSIELSRHEQVNVLSRDPAGEWLKVRTESGIEGWIRVEDTVLGDWVNTLTEVEEAGGGEEVLSVPTTLPVITEVVAANGNIAVYTAPRVKFDVITHINKGEIASVLGRWQEDPWVRIRLDDGTEGWVRFDKLVPADN